MAAAAAQKLPYFTIMRETGLRQWVKANPGRVNSRDEDGYTPLYATVLHYRSLSLVVWLLDEKGADVNATTSWNHAPIHANSSLDIFIALLDRGADPVMTDLNGWTALMNQAECARVDPVARLVQDPRIRATVNVQDEDGDAALLLACKFTYPFAAACIVHSLLQAGGNPTLTNKKGLTPVASLRQRRPGDSCHDAIALLEQYPDAEKTWLLVKARRLAVAASSHPPALSCLQSRAVQGQVLPRVELMPLTDDQTNGVNEDEGEEGHKLGIMLASLSGLGTGTEKGVERSRKLHTTLAFMCGLGREGMPRDVFWVVMDLLMPLWDPLRRENAGRGKAMGQG